MVVDLHDSFEELASFQAGSLDFIITSHVIEHVPNPIKAIVSCYNKLFVGGFLFFVVPDSRHTVDRGRLLTSVEHLFADYEKPYRERDFGHYLEYYQVAAQLTDYDSAATDAFEKQLVLRD